MMIVTASWAQTNYKTFTVGGVTFKMIKVEGGTFTMGATREQGSDVDSWEKPAHRVTLSSYYIGQTEVTEELWLAVMGYYSNFDGSTFPIYEVTWVDCQKFIRRLNDLTGQLFRLPTEAEWEFAARGGTKSRGYKFSGSNTLDDVAWYWGNSRRKPHPVGTKRANELGLYDMSGNVWEWCQDNYKSYSSSAQVNPIGLYDWEDEGRVRRGGSWVRSANYCRVSIRGSERQSNKNQEIGLRLALSE